MTKPRMVRITPRRQSCWCGFTQYPKQSKLPLWAIQTIWKAHYYMPIHRRANS